MASNTKVALLCAYTLASAKRYSEAEELLLSDGELAKTIEAMDLLARIRSEQGDTAEARRLWQEIQTLHPEHVPSRKALRNLGKCPRVFPWRLFLSVGIPLILLIGACLGFWVSNARQQAQTVVWPGIPTGEMLQTLHDYQGRVGRVLVSSHFFSQTDHLKQRAVLTRLIGEALDLPASQLFIGEGCPEQSQETIILTLERR